MSRRSTQARSVGRWGPLAAALALVACGSSPASAQDPLSQRVLVVYNDNVPESLGVANYYLGRRGIPESNRCAISPADTAAVWLADFDSAVKTPISNCLNAVGKASILYIVFSYQTPYVLLDATGYTYSLDQAVADIWNAYSPHTPFPYPERAHPYYTVSESQGNVYERFVSLAEYRSRPEALTIYSVWRLDAANADLARGLVDKAIWAETNGLSGQGCFDRRWAPIASVYDSSYGAGDWDLYKAAEFTRQAGFPVTEDEEEEEFGTPPAPLRCDDAALYTGWYSLDNYNDAFTWNPGAIGFHLDSVSAGDPRGGNNWSANALIRGITVTSGSVNEPYLEGLIRADGFYRNLFEGANVGDAAMRNTRWLQWMVLNLGDPLYRPFPGGFPAFDPETNPQSSLSLNPRFLIGGSPSTGTVTLARPAPEGGLVVELATSEGAPVTVPSTVSVPAGARSATFPIATTPVNEYSIVFITATFSGTTLSNTLASSPPPSVAP